MNEAEKAIRLDEIRRICREEGHRCPRNNENNRATYGDWPMNIFPCERGCGMVLLTLSDNSGGLAAVTEYLEGYKGTGVNFSIAALEIQVSPY